MRKKHYKNSKKKTVILVCVLIVVIILASVFALSEMKKAENVAINNAANNIYSFYSEEKGSLDGVYLGSSAATRYWVPARAFEQHGVCIYNLGTSMQPFVATKSLIEDALKNQPAAKVIIIELRAAVRGLKYTNESKFKIISDAMPYSLNRNEMIKEYLDACKEAGAKIDYGSLDYYYPPVRDKGVWLINYDISNLRTLYDDSYRPIDKGYGMSFDVEALNEPIEYTEKEPIKSYYEETVYDLLDYCKTLKQEVVFVSAPYESNYGLESKLRYVIEICEEEGFETLDFNCEPLQSQLELDWSKDFYNFKHMNTYGAVKYTDFLTNYITEKYEFENHSNEPGYESWHNAVKHLNDEIEKHKE